MAELDDLYQELILDHYKRPHNRRIVEDADCQAEGNNPLCGDRVTVFLKLDNNIVKDVSFQGSGCAISTASASMMTDAVKGRSVAQTKALFRKFRDLATGTLHDSDADIDLGKLGVFSGIRRYPVRVKCAVLAWHTLDAALDRRGEVVSTESEDAPAASEPHAQADKETLKL